MARDVSMTQNDGGGAQDQGSPLDEMLAEALDLVDATRRYLETRPAAPAIAPRELHHVREIDRITSRLGHVVAWLLTCKAGRNDLAAAAGRAAAPAIGTDPACLAQPAVPGLPGPLQDLLDASAALYGRAVRLATSGAGSLRLH